MKERQPKGKLKKTKKWMRGNQNLNETQTKDEWKEKSEWKATER